MKRARTGAHGAQGQSGRQGAQRALTLGPTARSILSTGDRATQSWVKPVAKFFSREAGPRASPARDGDRSHGGARSGIGARPTAAPRRRVHGRPPAYRGDAVLLRLVPEASRERAEDDAGNRSRLSNVVTAGPGPLSGLERAALAP